MSSGEIIVVVVLAVICALIIYYLVRKKKKGGGCNGDCSNCCGCSHTNAPDNKDKK